MLLGSIYGTPVLGFTVKIVRGNTFTARMFSTYADASTHYFAMTKLHGEKKNVTVNLPERIAIKEVGGVLSM